MEYFKWKKVFYFFKNVKNDKKRNIIYRKKNFSETPTGLQLENSGIIYACGNMNDKVIEITVRRGLESVNFMSCYVQAPLWQR